MYPPIEYQNFRFVSAKISPDFRDLLYIYKVEEITFEHKISLDKVSQENLKQKYKTHRQIIEAAVLAIGLAELPSYWKTFITPNIIIQAGYLSPEQIEFWINLYTNGLGEFFYKNKIDFRGLINISSDAKKVDYKNQKQILNFEEDKYLLPIGGGKDSIFSGELLAEEKKDYTAFMLEPYKFVFKQVQISPAKDFVYWRRSLDNFKQLKPFHGKGYPNGHVPISSVYAFCAILAGILNGYNKIAISQEKSSSEGNLEYLGKMINHQYSKSQEAEKVIAKYTTEFISPEIKYYSILRPYSEVDIFEKFAGYPKYFSDFVSCNKGLKSGSWCCNCAKCCFTFLGLAAFVGSSKAIQILGEDLFNKKSLLNIWEELIGIRTKPFDCVGTPDEVRQMFSLIRKQEPKALQKFDLWMAKELRD